MTEAYRSSRVFARRCHSSNTASRRLARRVLRTASAAAPALARAAATRAHSRRALRRRFARKCVWPARTMPLRRKRRQRRTVLRAASINAEGARDRHARASGCRGAWRVLTELRLGELEPRVLRRVVPFSHRRGSTRAQFTTPRAPYERAGARVHATRARAHQASRKMVFSVRCRNPAAARLIVDLRRDRSAKRTLRIGAAAYAGGPNVRKAKRARTHARRRIRAHAPACEAHVPHVAREVRQRNPMPA